MGAGLVLGVAGRLQLESRVLDVEMTGQAVLQLIEDLGGVAVTKARVVDDHVGRDGREVRRDRPHVQVMDVPYMGRLQQVGAQASRSKASGAASSRIRMDALSRPHEARSIRTTTTSEAMGSARSNPVAMMTMPATTVARNP